MSLCLHSNFYFQILSSFHAFPSPLQQCLHQYLFKAFTRCFCWCFYCHLYCFFLLLLHFRFVYFHTNELNGFCISVAMFCTSAVYFRHHPSAMCQHKPQLAFRALNAMEFIYSKCISVIAVCGRSFLVVYFLLLLQPLPHSILWEESDSFCALP